MEKDLSRELNEQEGIEFNELMKTSVWLSTPEKEMFSEEGRKNQSRYLVNILYEALKEEKVFFKDLKENDKSSYKVFNEVKEWLEDENKSVEGFMSISDEDGKRVFGTYAENRDKLEIGDWNIFKKEDDKKEKQEDIKINDIFSKIKNEEFFENVELFCDIDVKLNNFLFEEALSDIEKKLSQYPSNFFLIELYMQTKKCLGELSFEDLKDKIDINSSKFRAIELNYRFESSEINLDDLEDFKDDTYLKFYMFAKYYFYFYESDEYWAPLKFMNKALEKTDLNNNLSLAYLFNFYIKTLAYAQKYDLISKLLKDIYKNREIPLKLKYYIYMDEILNSKGLKKVELDKLIDVLVEKKEINNLNIETKILIETIQNISNLILILTENRIEFELKEDDIKIYRENYLKKDSFENFDLLVTKLYKDKKNKNELKELIKTNYEKYYFLSEINKDSFIIKHHLFTTSGLSINDKNSISRLTSIGISKEIFYLLYEALRWSEKYFYSFIFSLPNICLFNNEFHINMHITTIYNFYDIAIKLFLKQKISDKNYNNIALGLTKNTNKYLELIASLFYMKALNTEINLTLLSNSAINFKDISDFYNFYKVNHWALYRSFLSISINFTKTYSVYETAFRISGRLKYNELVLAIYFLAKKYKASILIIYNSYITNIITNFNINPKNILFYIYFFSAIKKYPKFTEEKLNIPDFEHLIFDILQKIQQLQKSGATIDKLFEKEAEITLKEHLIDDSCLTIKYPQKSYFEKFKIKIEELNKLYEDTKNEEYLKDVENLIDDLERDKFIEALNGGRIKHNYLKTIELSKNEVAIVINEYEKIKNKLLSIETEFYYIEKSYKIFKTILKHHALEHSEMFESFRTKIRHGWLISSIKDSFARHELYSDKNEISPHLEDLLSNCKNEKFAIELKDKLNIFKKEFDNLMSDLDKEYLWLRDEKHPNGLLDFSSHKFDIEKIFTNNNFLELSIDNLIIEIVKEIDLVAKKNFKNIKLFLKEKIYKPLNDKLIEIEKFLNKNKNYFNENKLIHKWYDIYEKVENAKKEFKSRVEDYQAWFDFEESAIRDFNLNEILEVAKETVNDLMQSQMKELNINPPKVEIDESVKNIYFKGSNFSDILEIFKILLQNIIYHSKDENEQNEIDTNVEIKRREKNIRVKVTSTTTKEIDIETLKEKVFNETKRKICLTGKEGSGLATIEEILLNRLDGVKGKIEDIKLENSNFIVEFKFEIFEEGKKREIKEDSFYREIDTNKILSEIDKSQINILVVEDQESKFNAIREFLKEFIINANIVNIYDLESASKILADGFKKFDFMLLDMTLPLYPKANAPLKSLAGLTILKIMQVHNLKLPTILVTQYSNWFEEAKHNSRQFIESIDNYSKKEFESFRGVVKFSHTDLTWQDELKELIESDSDFKYKHLQVMQKNIELLRQDQIMAISKKIARQLSHSLNNSLQTFNSFINLNKMILEEKGDNQYLESFDIAQKEVKNMARIIKHFRDLAKGDKEKVEIIDINAVIKSAIFIQKEQLKSYNIEINENLSSTAFIEANLVMLKQVFINLILNARDSLNEIKRDKKYINISTEFFLKKDREYLKISICDNGKGLESTNLDKIFKPFFTTKGTKGMGLGLAETKDTIEKLKGEIKVFNQKDGVCFEIKLPIFKEKM